MNTQLQGIPSTEHSANDRLIPAPVSIAPSLIEKLTASHAAVLENWKSKFALDLRWHRAIPAAS